MSLEAIIETANLLLQTTLNANVGFQEISAKKEKFIFTHKEEEILKLVMHLEQLKKQRRDLQYTLEKKRWLEHFTSSELDETSEETSLGERIKEKRKVWTALNSKNQVIDKAVKK